LIDGGYIEGGQYYYYLTDHLGNNRLVVNSGGAVVQKNHYYPFGMSFAETSVAEQGKQPYKFGGKELDQMNGLNLYDNLARFYDPAFPHTLTPDPLCENYYPISPYVWCMNNPVNAVDMTGKDVWEINNQGDIINRIKDKTQDAFYMVAKDADGNYQRTFTTDAEGNKNYNSISFEYGTITSVQEKTVKTDVGEVTLTMFNVKGDESAKQLFEFAANQGTIEWSHDKIGTEESQKNIVGTIHMQKNTVQGTYLSKYGYIIREDNHSHPQGTGPSPADLTVAGKILAGNSKTLFNIYNPITKKYIPYNSNGIIPK